MHIKKQSTLGLLCLTFQQTNTWNFCYFFPLAISLIIQEVDLELTAYNLQHYLEAQSSSSIHGHALFDHNDKKPI
jgi:hypothetical protein